MKKTFLNVSTAIVLSLLVVVLPACSVIGGGSGKLKVYTSFYVMTDLTKKIAGDKVEITTLIKPGLEPHDWEPSPQDVIGIRNADMLILSGAAMEPWYENILPSLTNKKLTTVVTSTGIKTLELKPGEEALDPHLWLSPLNAKAQSKAIADALSQKDPANKDFYQKNYLDNAKKFDELDVDFKAAAVKFKNKNIIVSHMAFSYLSVAYGLNQIAIEGDALASEPSSAKMARIVDFARQNNIKTVYMNMIEPTKSAEAVAKEIGAITLDLSSIEWLTEKQTSQGEEYFSIMRKNLESLNKGQN